MRMRQRVFVVAGGTGGYTGRSSVSCAGSGKPWRTVALRAGAPRGQDEAAVTQGGGGGQAILRQGHGHTVADFRGHDSTLRFRVDIGQVKKLRLYSSLLPVVTFLFDLVSLFEVLYAGPQDVGCGVIAATGPQAALVGVLGEGVHQHSRRRAPDTDKSL